MKNLQIDPDETLFPDITEVNGENFSLVLKEDWLTLENIGALINAIKIEAGAQDLTVETASGRDVIKSLAYKIARTKTALDNAAKAMTDEQRAVITRVDGLRRVWRDNLDVIKTRIRQPLTDWEEAEKVRVAASELAEKREADHALACVDNIEFDRVRELERGKAEAAEREAALQAEIAEIKASAGAERVKARAMADKAARDVAEAAEAVRKSKADAEDAAEAQEAKAKAVAEHVAAEAAHDKRVAAEAVAKAKADADKSIMDERARVAAEVVEAERVKVAEAARLEQLKVDDAEAKEQEKRKADSFKRLRENVRGNVRACLCRYVHLTPQQAYAVFDFTDNGDIPHVSIDYSVAEGV